MFDIIIIGGGISGLTASIYAKRAGKKVLLLEEKNFGGQIINSNDIENYPGLNHVKGIDLTNNLLDQVKELNVEIKLEKVLEIDVLNSIKKVITNNNSYETKSIIISTGSDYRKLGLDKEEDLVGKGVSYCATCDGNFYKDKDVMVVGGGNTALYDAIYLSDICKNVYLVHRKDYFTAEELLVNKAKNKDNIKIIYNSNIKKINGNEVLESVELDSNEIIKVDGLFIAVGRIPNTAIFSNILKTNEYGYIITDDNLNTNIKGIFASGDVRDKKLRQLVTATSDGAVAAMEAVSYLNGLNA